MLLIFFDQGAFFDFYFKSPQNVINNNKTHHPNAKSSGDRISKDSNTKENKKRNTNKQTRKKQKRRSENLRRIERNQGGNNRTSCSVRSNTKKKKKRKTNPAPPVIGTVSTRTRHQQKTQASRWNQPVPILMNILS